MRLKKLLAVLLVILLVIPQGVLAQSQTNTDHTKNVLIVAGTVTVVGLSVYLYNSVKTNLEVKKLYNDAEEKIVQGDWFGAYEKLNLIMHKKHNYKDAKSKLELVKEVGANYYTDLGDRQVVEQRLEEAALNYRKVLMMSPNNLRARAGLDNLNSRLADMYYNRSLGYFSEGDFKETELELNKAVALNPDMDKTLLKEVLAINQNQKLTKVAIIFLGNQSSVSGIEAIIMPRLQEFLERDNLIVLSQLKVRAFMDEQGKYLFPTYDTKAAVETGLILGQDKVIYGDLTKSQLTPFKKQTGNKLQQSLTGELEFKINIVDVKATTIQTEHFRYKESVTSTVTPLEAAVTENMMLQELLQNISQKLARDIARRL